MTANERRAEIMRILSGRRFETMSNLAFHFNVHRTTIFKDIETLTLDHPIETVRGNGGGVRFMKDYRMYCNNLTHEQQELLISLIPTIDKRKAELLKEILLVHGSVRNKSILED